MSRVLAIEPYYGGSHRAFLDGWIARSAHQWTTLSLPAYKWKWRMRHAPVTLAGNAREHVARGEAWDVLFCSDMLNLAEFRGLAPKPVAELPAIVYFHENQLTYPVRQTEKRDLHFAYTNITTALAAEAVWFNTAYHRGRFLETARDLLMRMPDFQHVDLIDSIRKKAQVHPPGIDEPSPRGTRRPGPMRILWAARWEHDKDPETFFAALDLLRRAGVDFRVSVIGESFSQVPAIFEIAKDGLADHIDRWGYQASRADYDGALSEADVIVSTAIHEFFGISVVEAIAAGAYPVVPNRLSYPEILTGISEDGIEGFLYDGTAEALAARLQCLSARIAENRLWGGDSERCRRGVARFIWPRLVEEFDQAVFLLD